MIIDLMIGQSRHGGGRPSFLSDFSDYYPDFYLHAWNILSGRNQSDSWAWNGSNGIYRDEITSDVWIIN